VFDCKGKGTHLTDPKAQKGGRGIALLSLELGAKRGGWLARRPGRFTPGKDSVHIVQEAGWAPGPVWAGAENIAPTGIRSPDRPARSRYTDWACVWLDTLHIHSIVTNVLNVLRQSLAETKRSHRRRQDWRLKAPIHVPVWLSSPAGLGFQSVKLIRVWNVTSRTLADYIYIYIYICIRACLTESSYPRRTLKPDSCVYGHLYVSSMAQHRAEVTATTQLPASNKWGPIIPNTDTPRRTITM
jgi:hypothetical protein